MALHFDEHPLDMATGATALAHQLLHAVGTRWPHTRAVVSRAGVAAVGLPAPEATTLLSAAWLHDIGYAPRLADTGFHPLDGARWLTTAGWPPDVARLVAHHSASRYVADERGLNGPMSSFEDPHAYRSPVADALTWADQTTGPVGQQLDVQVRLDDMLRRHGLDSPNGRCHHVRAPAILASVARAEAAIARSCSLVHS